MSQTLAFQELASAALAARPEVALVLGSGLSGVARRLERARSVPFKEVPGLGATSVAGHRGQITLGEWGGKCVLLFEGRLHYYEGHPWRGVTLPVQTARFFGARVLLLTNAAGGIHDTLVPGSLMAIRDHVEWTTARPWLQPGPGALGPPRLSPYSPRLVSLLTQAGRDLAIDVYEGIYAALTGPCYETPAEIRALQRWGVDAVGMSTAREIHAGNNAGMECAALSCITNRAAGLSQGPLHHEDVLAAAAERHDCLADLLERFLQLL